MKILKNARGQATMEAVLLMIIFVTFATKISTFAKQQGFVTKIVEGPWSPVRGMIEDGVWRRHTDSKPLHPNHLGRHQARRGDDR